VIDITDTKELNDELERAIVNLSEYHNDMTQQQKYYKYSAFYPRKHGDTPNGTDFRINLLKVFADKNIHYTSQFPVIKVPTTGATPEQRQAASVREKILYAVHQACNTELKQKKWATDATIFSVAISETGFDLKSRKPFVKRYDPRYVFWQLSNDNEQKVQAFWAVFPITAEECKKKYGFTPTKHAFSSGRLPGQFLSTIDGQDWFAQAIRWDATTRVSWVGNEMVEEPHNHMMGEIPIDICIPFDDSEKSNQGAFYLEPLIAPQAELNHTLKQRAAIADRMANPVVWGRGIMGRQFDDVKQNLEKSGGGFVGLKQTGELGLLQVKDVTLLNEHAADIISNMMRLSGFSAAAFGESVGANTSGDALGMYFTPTQRLIENQNISWAAFYKSINAKILRSIEVFGKPGETFSIAGFNPGGTVLASESSDYSKKEYSSGSFDITFDKTVIGGNYSSVVTFSNVTPKNEDTERRFWLDAANQKIVSRTTAFENIGILSPEDELALLTQEQQEPALNPDGTQKILQTANQFMQQQPQLPQAQPATIAPTGAVNGA